MGMQLVISPQELEQLRERAKVLRFGLLVGFGMPVLCAVGSFFTADDWSEALLQSGSFLCPLLLIGLFLGPVVLRFRRLQRFMWYHPPGPHAAREDCINKCAAPSLLEEMARQSLPPIPDPHRCSGSFGTGIVDRFHPHHSG